MEDDVKIVIGKRVKEIRSSKGLSQEKLALKSNIDRTYITSVENGKRNISIEMIQKICKGMDISIKDLFDCGDFK